MVVDERQASRMGAPAQVVIPGTAARLGVDAVDMDFKDVWAEVRTRKMLSGIKLVYIMTLLFEAYSIKTSVELN